MRVVGGGGMGGGGGGGRRDFVERVVKIYTS